MSRLLLAGAVLAVAAGLAAPAHADNLPVPFPAEKVLDIFVGAQTVTPDGAMSSWFAPGSSVVFRAYAADPKTKQLLTPKNVRYFYVAIPDQPNLKLTYDASAQGAGKAFPWTAKWTVPATYASGVVNFKVLIQAKEKTKTGKQRKGEFVQLPVAASMLNISSAPPPLFAPAAPAGGGTASTNAIDLALYVDSVNGTAPAGIPSRPVGCTQTNVFKRGERVVIRAWGSDLSTNDVLSNDNIKEAHTSIAGQPDLALNWGAHGATNAKVFYWTNAWIVPPTYPLGETTVHVVFTTETGKTTTYDYTLNIIPS